MWLPSTEVVQEEVDIEGTGDIEIISEIRAIVSRLPCCILTSAEVETMAGEGLFIDTGFVTL
jgi:hypothetical protein